MRESLAECRKAFLLAEKGYHQKKEKMTEQTALIFVIQTDDCWKWAGFVAQAAFL